MAAFLLIGIFIGWFTFLFFGIILSPDRLRSRLEEMNDLIEQTKEAREILKNGMDAIAKARIDFDISVQKANIHAVKALKMRMDKINK